ncbi:ArsR/SmtB family transcription factor [Propionibacteriaceae bacterium Y2011]|uniref:ArsR/SmtB family transcription factor n=1 Tax=Microlunatus sp. Y2014 TaxID=3418488 RepID=UPI003B4CBEE1
MTIHAEGGERLLPESAAGLYAHLFQALSDPTRLAIVHHLTSGEHRVRDLVDHLGLAQSTVSVHVARLRDCGLVSTASRGRATVVALQEPDAVAAMLDAAGAFLLQTGQTQHCPHLDSTGEAAS